MYSGGYLLGFDWTYILVIIGLVISLIAQAKVKSTFNQYSKVMSKSGLNGSMAARQILNQSGLMQIPVARISGDLTDNYSPVTQTVSLSDSTYASPSVAAIGVAAHECGHAIQHAKGYGPLKLRSAMYPAASFTQKIAWPIILLGFIFTKNMGSTLITIGILLFCVGVLFQLVTLPVEFNASSRAVQILKNSGNMDENEIAMVKKVLTAAALTYVAAAASSVLALLRLVLLSRNRR